MFWRKSKLTLNIDPAEIRNRAEEYYRSGEIYCSEAIVKTIKDEFALQVPDIVIAICIKFSLIMGVISRLIFRKKEESLNLIPIREAKFLKSIRGKGEKMGMNEKPKKSAANEGKRGKLLSEKKRISPWSIALIVLLIIAFPVSWFILRGIPQEGSKKVIGSQVMENVNYQNQTIAMTRVEAAIKRGVLEIPVDLVRKNKLVYFEYQGSDKFLPLLAYITPTGKLVTAVSMCEPCNSKSFHIERNEMVCNACFTRWNLETLKGISGGCLAYPPDVISHSVQDGRVLIKEVDLQTWNPRIFRG